MTNSKQRLRVPLPMLGAFIPFMLLLWFSWRGIDFGVHWDEDFCKIEAVDYSLDHEFTLLPNNYSYPGVNYWLTFLTMSPELLTLASKHELTLHNYSIARAELKPLIHSLAFRLRLRRVYSFVVALTAVWIYFTVLVWNRSWAAALVGSLAFASSWEVVYHSRWIAPDGILMQFAALTFLFASLAWKRHWPPALRAAAVAAGLACGSKYPGGLVLVSVLAVVWLRPVGSWQKTLQALRESIRLGAIFFVSYLVTTPGTVLDPLKFLHWLGAQRRVYAMGWYGYSITPGVHHFVRLLNYLTTQFFSTSVPLAMAFSLLAMVGLLALARESWRDAVMVMVFPLPYILYFSAQAAMIVRNYLVVAPYLAFLIAIGTAWALSAIPWRPVRWGLLLAVAASVAWNGAIQGLYAESVAHRRDTGRFVAQLEDYVQSHPQSVMAISPKVEDVLKARQFLPQPNLVPEREIPAAGHPPTEFVSFYSESVGARALIWPTNKPHSFAAVFGPREVNLDYYTGWSGDDRIVSVTAATAIKMGLAVVGISGRERPGE